jgi:hypothetical protein
MPTTTLIKYVKVCVQNYLQVLNNIGISNGEYKRLHLMQYSTISPDYAPMLALSATAPVAH